MSTLSKHRLLTIPILLTALLGLAIPQQAFASGFGVSAGASTFEDCPSFCTGDADFDSDGGEFAALASAVSLLYGESKSRAFYDQSEAYLPVLKASSISSNGMGGSASAFGVQGFTYTGATTRDITILFNLDANVIDSGSFGAESVSGSIGVLGADPLGPSPGYVGDFGTWYFENLGTPLGNDFVSVNTPNGTNQGSITFSVDPGDRFFVGASLNASSRTGTADAFNTFTSSFSDPDLLPQLTVANPVGIPEPSGLAVSSLAMVGYSVRRRRS